MSYDCHTILVPFDFSQQCLDAIRHALTIASDTGSIHVVHIIDDFYPSYAAIRYPKVVEEKQRILHMWKMTEQIESAGIDCKRVSLHCELGNPGFEIVECAKRLAADLIVIPSHGRSGVTRWLLGSVAERVAQLSRCPVLILKRASAEQKEGAT